MSARVLMVLWLGIDQDEAGNHEPGLAPSHIPQTYASSKSKVHRRATAQSGFPRMLDNDRHCSHDSGIGCPDEDLWLGQAPARTVASRFATGRVLIRAVDLPTLRRGGQ
jgi:hypothetical protein